MQNKDETQTPTQSVNGYSLFIECEDYALKCHNRATVMANISEEHYDPESKKVSTRGLYLILDYFNHIPLLERAAAANAYTKIMKERGIKSDRAD